MVSIRWIAIVFVVGLVVPCPRALLAAEPAIAGIVFVVGGVGGLDPLQACAPWALPRAGVPHRIEVFAWTHGKCRPLRDLQDVRYALVQADRLAAAVREVQARDPGRPIYLIGHSAGAGIVLAAAEQLPPSSLERIILLASAVSPTYDLRAALRATRRELVAFNSTYDRMCLDWCTSLFGTLDRVYGPSAGLDGFQEPANLDDEGRCLYRRLVQMHWHFNMLLQGTDGLHNGSCMPIYLAHRVAPWLMPDEPSVR